MASRRDVLKAAGIGAGTVALGTGPGGTATAQSSSYNFAEALQKSLYFYDANRCGPGVTGGRLEWRGDCHTTDTEVPLDAAMDEGGTNLSQGFLDQYGEILDPDGTGTVDVSGGFHDAGDHVKFGLPEAYSAATIGWACHEFEDAFREIGSYDHIVDHLRWFADYFLRCLFRDDDGEVVAFCYQVTSGDYDHNYWGSPELQDPEESPRPAYFATPENPASDRSAAAAAALAVIALNLESEDQAFADECLEAAEALYRFADEHRGIPQTATPYYESTGDDDQLALAALWLYVATGEQGYLEDVVGTDGSGNYTGHIGEIVSSTDDGWNDTWTHSWDSVWTGVIVKLVDVTGDEQWRELARWNLAFWSGGDVPHEDGSENYIQTTPAGFSYLDQWGSARYNAAAQFMAVCYRKFTGEESVTDWALGQMQYIMGDNPFGYSLIVGFTDEYAERPHHDAAHGTTSGQPEEPEDHRHTLWGALVGGPDDSDNHVDETDDYIHNEVAIDYNAGLVGALAGLYTYYSEDDEPLADFPPEHDPGDEFFVEASVEQEGTDSVDISAYVHNETFYPPRLADDVRFRYFFEVSDLLEASGSIDDVGIDVTYDEQASQHDGSATVEGPVAWNENEDEDEDVYYVEFDYTGAEFHGERELSFILSAYGVDGFDPTTDPSYQGLSSERSVTEYMPVYRSSGLVFGQEPDGGSSGERPTAPADQWVNEATETSIEIGWEAVNGADTYRVYLEGALETEPTATTATITDLEAGTEYQIGLSSVVDGEESDVATTTVSTLPADGDGPPSIDDYEPADTTGDGLYNDVTGSGRTTTTDVNVFFENVDRSAVADYPEYYDFDGNGRVTVTDVVELFDSL